VEGVYAVFVVEEDIVDEDEEENGEVLLLGKSEDETEGLEKGVGL